VIKNILPGSGKISRQGDCFSNANETKKGLWTDE